jgi:hypothetical protein
MREKIPLACLGAAVVCFALGYALALPWYWESAPLVFALLWLFAGTALPDLCLVASILVAALGGGLSADIALMALGVSASLALWDFRTAARRTDDSDAEDRIEDGSRVRAEGNYRRARLPYLALALGIGAAIAAIGSRISLRISFYVMTVLVLVCVFGLDRLAARLRDKK